MTSEDVVLKYVAPIRVAELTAIAASYGPLDVGPAVRLLFPELLRRLALTGIQPSGGPAMTFYEEPGEPSDTVIVHAAIPVLAGPRPAGRFAVVDLPAIPATATIIHRGAANGITRTLLELAGWMDDNGYRPGPGLHREIYLGHYPGDAAGGPIELQVTVAGIAGAGTEPDLARPGTRSPDRELAGVSDNGGL